MPFGGVCAVKAVGAALMVMVKGVQSKKPPTFVARITIAPETPPAPVGVPESTPAPLKLKPGGNVPDCTA